MSSTTKSNNNNEDNLILENDRRHTAVMILLYLSQGMVFGSNNACATLLMQYREVTLTEQSLLTLPSYAFSFKFLWAPLVDSIYKTKRTRRPSWILSCQVLICIFSLLIRMYWFSFLRDHVGSLVSVMALMSFTVATQDIAVDSWALEGVDTKRAAWAGTAQTIGLLTGFCSTRSFFILQDWDYVSKEHGAQGLFSVLLGVQLVTLAVAFVYRYGTKTCELALDSAERREIKILKEKKMKRQQQQQQLDLVEKEKKPQSSISSAAPRSASSRRRKQAERDQDELETKVTSFRRSVTSLSSSHHPLVILEEATTFESFMEVIHDMKEIVSQVWFRDVCIIILLRGIVHAGGGLIGTQMMKRYGATPAFSSTLSFVLLPLQLFISSASPAILNALRDRFSWSVLESWFAIYVVDLMCDAASWLSFTFCASDSQEYKMHVTVPSSVIGTILGTVAFNSGATFFSKLASRVPHSTGTAITLLNSMSNFGNHWPQTVGLWIGGKMTEVFFSVGVSSSEDANDPAEEASVMPLKVTYIVMWSFFAIGLVIHFGLIYPAVQRLKLLEEDEKKNDEQNKEKKEKME